MMIQGNSKINKYFIIIQIYISLRFFQVIEYLNSFLFSEFSIHCFKQYFVNNIIIVKCLSKNDFQSYISLVTMYNTKAFLYQLIFVIAINK